MDPPGGLGSLGNSPPLLGTWTLRVQAPFGGSWVAGFATRSLPETPISLKGYTFIHIRDPINPKKGKKGLL